MKDSEFAFKELLVWQKALFFANDVIDVTEKLNSSRKHYRLIDQIEAASASVAQNIAEGKGRYSKKEFRQFLFYSRGSLYETITILNIFYLRNWISKEKLEDMEAQASEIAKMINGLVKSIN